MSFKVTKIEQFNNKLVTLTQKTAQNKYLILDIWEDNNDTVHKDRYKQVLLQINNLKIHNISDNRIYFDITDRQDVINSITKIEDNTIELLKSFLLKINKKGKFNFLSVVKMNNSKTLMVLDLNNEDYSIKIFDHDKKIRDISFMSNNTNSFNIIIELMSINFDMFTGNIVIDTRLRMVMSNPPNIVRSHLTDPDLFIKDDNINIHNNIQNQNDHKKPFDLTQTEVINDDSDRDDLKPELKDNLAEYVSSDTKDTKGKEKNRNKNNVSVQIDPKPIIMDTTTISNKTSLTPPNLTPPSDNDINVTVKTSNTPFNSPMVFGDDDSKSSHSSKNTSPKQNKDNDTTNNDNIDLATSEDEPNIKSIIKSESDSKTESKLETVNGKDLLMSMSDNDDDMYVSQTEFENLDNDNDLMVSNDNDESLGRFDDLIDKAEQLLSERNTKQKKTNDDVIYIKSDESEDDDVKVTSRFKSTKSNQKKI